MTHHHTNKLIHEKSPYLLQHAHNPVDWQPWGPEAWQEAADRQVPVIVSIGYSTCHWCHVMEHECFEDTAVAEIMNSLFVCIKVDREEHLDVDGVYMDACQLITGRGGWPLNVVCLPDKRPFFAGTYFPKDRWTDVLQQLSSLWKQDPEKLLDYAQRIESGLQQMNLLEYPPSEAITRKDLQEMMDTMQAEFDTEFGGLKRNQKFPLPAVYEMLLDLHLTTGDKDIKDFLNFTLIKMANGGIYDHLRGGFYRYTVDPYWFVPHFEKMLYDNAQLISLYARACSLTGAEIYRTVVIDSIACMQREMRDNSGGYYAALDADSEGIEGKFYIFTAAELQSILQPEAYDLVKQVYDIREEGNWEHGYNVLSKALSPLQLLEKTGLDVHRFNQLLGAAHASMRQLQDQRPRPSLDNKKICSWNGLMLRALALAGTHLDLPEYVKEAQELASWMLQHFKEEGKLLRIAGSQTRAYAEDYACFIQGLIALYEADGNGQWIEVATGLADELITNHLDREKGLFQTSADSQLLVNKVEITDDVIPSDNAMMAISLQKLGILQERADLLALGKEMLPRVRSQVKTSPVWHAVWAQSAMAEAIGLLQLGIIGPESAKQLKEMRNVLPSWTVLAREHSNMPPFVAHKATGPAGLYLCLDQACFEPVSESYQAEEILEDVLGSGV